MLNRTLGDGIQQHKEANLYETIYSKNARLTIKTQ